ncbi:SCO7613 C-terminal domain-containing membrane protein [Streptomyces goshikiensis]|uniref:SCO7613 C-terminal domain-containing membrane protein n=1 Tax=Streptomyces goshikiensis TaxID=1942 RepID=UPI00367E7AD4
MNTPLPPADELALIDRELGQLDARRLYLLARRDWLLRQPAPLVWGAPAAAAAPGRPEEASAPGAQNLLLTLGAVLLAVAALAFTLVSWGSLGIGGRSAVLAVVTAAALVTPAPLLRRGLRSTAESVAAVGLLLTVLDAYALFAVGMPAAGADTAAAYAAGAAAVLAAAWAGYGRALPALRIPLPAALLTAQLPLPLAAPAADAGPAELGWALLATAALDLALAASAPARWPARAAWIPAAALGAGALLIGLSESAVAASAADATAPAALLAAVAALGVAAAWRIPGAWPAATAGGLAAVAALGGTARPELAPGWAVVTHLALALPLLAAVRVTALPEPVRLGLARAGAGIAGLAALWGCAAVVIALAARLRVLDEVWAATTPAAGVPLTQPGAAAPVALLLAAGAARWLSRTLPGRPEAAVPAVPAVLAVALGWGGLFTAPLTLGLPVAAVLAAQLAVTAAAGLLALRSPDRPTAIAAGAVALLGAGNVSLAALDGRAATFAVLGLLGAGCAAGAAYAPAPRWARSGAAALAVGYATALVVALSALTDLAAPWWALPLLAVPAAVTAAGPRLGAQRLAAEAAAAAAGVLALALACGDAPVLALALALAGVVCAGSAVRADRRALGWAAGVLFVAAAWVRLASAGVAAAEAYTLPVTLPALAVGFLRRRRDPAASSWTAYGPGLAATLLPSLAAAWGDPHWPRPLLLGVAALGLTLAGAHRRLRAPLLLGGGTLAAVALHELAPYVVQVVDALPRWLPPALAGLLLLAVGATYEKRLRDARRLRSALGRLR